MKQKYEEAPLRPYRCKPGVHPEHHKNTATLKSKIMPPPAKVEIPLSMHIGAPAAPVVAEGDKVCVGQLIAEAAGFVSSPIHASVSGIVKGFGSITVPSGASVKTVIIESDGQMTPAELHPPKCDTREELVDAVRKSGLVGLGGAGFPTHVKLSVPPDKSADVLIINAAECEPFITADHREMLENSYEIMSGLYTLKDLLGIHRVIIGVESNKPDAIKALTAIASNRAHDPRNEVRVMTLSTAYPRGAEKVLVQCCTGRRVPPGKLPIDVGCIVMNISSVAFLASYLKTGMPLVSKRVTVDGGAISEPSNVIVPIGTPYSDVIAFCGGYKSTPKKLLSGGPMMGLALRDDSLPVMKQTNAIIALSEEQAVDPAPSDCIRCGRCVDRCPMDLVPTMLAHAVERKDLDALRKYGLMNCIECGSCTFTCPAHRYLLQTLRAGKQLLRENPVKKQ